MARTISCLLMPDQMNQFSVACDAIKIGTDRNSAYHFMIGQNQD